MTLSKTAPVTAKGSSLPLQGTGAHPLTVNHKAGDLAKKVFAGKVLTKEELSSLAQMIKAKPLTNKKDGKYSSKVQKVLDLAKVLKGEGVGAKVQEAFAGQDKPSKAMGWARAKLLIGYYKKLKPLHDRKRPNLPEVKLARLVADYNRILPAKRKRAGRLAWKLGARKIFYGVNGKLVLGTPEGKVVHPIEGNGKLGEKVIKGVIDIHKQVVDPFRYNNLGAVLELMSYYRAAKKNNPKLTLTQAFESFQLSAVEVFEKYRTGNCVLASAKMEQELHGVGIKKPAIVGQYSQPIWGMPPIPVPKNRKVVWKAYDKATQSVHHCAVVVLYSSKKEERGLMLQAGNLKVNDWEDRSWNEVERLMFGKKQDTRGNITNIGHILKMQIRGKWKAVITGPKGKAQVLGLDLIRDKFYISSRGIEGLKGVPTTRYHRCFIPFSALAKQEAKGEYFIDGKTFILKHRKALERIYKLVSGRFRLPKDFCPNMLTLSENINSFFTEILLPPSNFMRNFWEDGDKALEHRTQLKDYASYFKGKMFRVKDEELEEALKGLEKKFKKFEKKFEALQKAFIARDEKGVQKLIAEMDDLWDESEDDRERLIERFGEPPVQKM